LRTLRLLRLVRLVRMVSCCRPLWKLTQSFLQCAPTMLSAFSIILMILYIFACVGAEVIGQAQWNDPTITDHVRVHFSSLPRILLSLIQFVTGDSISGIYFPLIVNRPMLCIYFVALIITVTLALMNLVVATLVEDAISMARMDSDMEAVYTRRKLNAIKPGIKEWFHQIDTDEDGALTMQEVVAFVQSGLVVPAELKGILTEAHIVDLYEGLDIDGDGVVTINEFVDCLCNAAVSDVPLETMRMVQMLRTAMSQISRMEKVLHELVTPPRQNADGVVSNVHCF